MKKTHGEFKRHLFKFKSRAAGSFSAYIASLFADAEILMFL